MSDLIAQSLANVRNKNAGDQARWKDKQRFNVASSKVKKNVKVVTKVQKAHGIQSLQTYMSPSKASARPTSTTLSAWMNSASPSKRPKTAKSPMKKKVSSKESLTEDQMASMLAKSIAMEQASLEPVDANVGLEKAFKAAQAINKNDIATMKGLNNPPSAIKDVSKWTMVLLTGSLKEQDTNWAAFKKAVSNPGQFLASLVLFTASKLQTIPPKTLKKLAEVVAQPEFTPKVMETKAAAAKQLCNWIIKVYQARTGLAGRSMSPSPKAEKFQVSSSKRPKSASPMKKKKSASPMKAPVSKIQPFEPQQNEMQLMEAVNAAEILEQSEQKPKPVQAQLEVADAFELEEVVDEYHEQVRNDLMGVPDELFRCFGSSSSSDFTGLCATAAVLIIDDRIPYKMTSKHKLFEGWQDFRYQTTEGKNSESWKKMLNKPLDYVLKDDVQQELDSIMANPGYKKEFANDNMHPEVFGVILDFTRNWYEINKQMKKPLLLVESKSSASPTFPAEAAAPYTPAKMQMKSLYTKQVKTYLLDAYKAKLNAQTKSVPGMPAKTVPKYPDGPWGADEGELNPPVRSKIPISTDGYDEKMAAEFAQLQQVRKNRNTDFYDEHNKNYYKHKGKSQLKRDQKETSVQLLKKHKEDHLVEQAHDRVYGKPVQDFQVDKKVERKAAKKPLDFLEAEIARR